jgi:DNA-binding NtrC family response regulator
MTETRVATPPAAPVPRRPDLLPALTSALEILGTARDPTAALTESFQHAARAFGAEKALLLQVRAPAPLALESLRSSGLDPEHVAACVSGRPVDGVSASRIRLAVETGETQLVENSQLDGKDVLETGSLRGRPHSVLCAPVSDPWTRTPLAVLYFQTTPGPHGYSSEDLPLLRGYATALGHAFGLFLTGEQRYRKLEEDKNRLEQDRPGPGPELIGDSEEVGRLREELHETYLPATAVRQPRPILLQGATGTGKDLVARYLHHYSPTRGRGPFIDCNCSSLSGDLVATTLFGHVRGAFTGATDNAQGLFRAAEQGTLFLDEIGEMPRVGQDMLLKVLDRWSVRPVGDTHTYEVDVQLVCATSRDLAAAVREGRFRHDLYQRLKALTIRLPPLCERPGDLRPLLTHFLAQAERALQKRTRGLTAAALRALLAYAWPGNVRELQGVAWALVTHGRPGMEIGLEDIRRHSPDVLSTPASGGVRFAQDEVEGSFRQARARFERAFLVHRVELHHWNVPEAARSLGLSTATLYRYLQRHGLRQGDGPPG